jgi:hypothetical protein
MCIHYLHLIHPSTPFSTTSPLLLVPTALLQTWQDLSAFMCNDFVEEKRKKKKMTFLFVYDKGSYTDVL